MSRANPAEDPFREMIDMLPALAWSSRPDGAAEFINRAWLEYTGLSVDEALGAGWTNALHPDDVSTIAAYWQAALATGGAAEIEGRLRRFDGEYRWFLFRAKPLRDEAGQVTKWFGTNTDIDQRKRAEDALRDTERKFRLLAETIPALVWRGTPEGELDYLNDRAVRYLGQTAENLAGERWLDLVHPEEREATITRWLHSAITGQSYEDVYRLRRADGEYRWIHSVGEPFQDADGRILHWFGLIIDVDDRKRAELALADSERQLRLIVDTIPAFVCTMNSQGQLETANRQLIDYMGMGSRELKEWESIGTVHEEDLLGVIASWRHSVETGKAYDIEHRIRRADGVFRWFHVRGLPLRDEDNRVLRWYVLLTDIEDRKRAETARVRAEQDVQESELRLRQIIETLPAVVWRASADGAIDFANHRLEEYTGKALQEVAGERWVTTLHPEDVSDVVAAWKEAREAGVSYDVTFRVRRADGEYRWVRVIGEPLRDVGGAIRNWYGLMLDVDDRKRALDALRDSERELRQLVDSIPGMIAVADATGMHEYANRRAMEYVGMSLPEVVELGWISTIHPEEQDRVRDEWLRCVSAGTPMDIAHRWRRHDGEYRWFHARVDPLVDEHGHVVRWYGVLTDIEDRKQAEQTLSASEARLRLIIDAIPALVWRAGAQGEMEYVNKRVTDYTGESFEDAVHSGLITIHPDDRDFVVQAWMRAIETSEPFSVTYRLRGADGIHRWFDAESEPLRDAEGRVLNWFGLATNVDENRKMLLELRETRDKLSRASRVATVAELSASIAHEINQPLAAIVANGEAAQAWLASRPADLDRANASLERIVRDGHAAAGVVRRIRALFQHAPPTKEPSDVNAILLETLRLVAEDIRQHGIVVETNLAADLPPVPADRMQLQHAVLNLVHNAIEAMQNIGGRQRTLSLVSEPRETEILVAVADQGSGVPDPTLMFEPFFTTKVNGMGMGLAICRTIIEAHGGRLWATPNDGPGTTFVFTVPQSDADSSPR